MVRWYGIELLTLYKDNLDWLLLKINNHNHVASDTGPKGSNQQEHTLTIRPDQINGFAAHRTDLPILELWHCCKQTRSRLWSGYYARYVTSHLSNNHCIEGGP